MTLSGMPAPGQTPPTPVVKANAEAAWPEGHDVERGMLTWRVTGTA